MNRIHRLVWNEHTGSWVAVAETARSRGKGSGRGARKAFLAALIASGLGMSTALADQPATTVVPASGKTNAYISANGVPVVNIETANAVGLSHNLYTRYDVETNGLVLNNGNNSQIARQSQLAGQVVSNLNLVQEAKVILNEVVSTNRSTLAGFTEVLGGKADVIVANPNGITCNGCGFINTDHATLTTGTSNIGADGSLTGFTVNRGDVLITGLGANASTQQIFDIVARSVKLDGKISTVADGSLGVTTGNNIWNYAGRNVTGTVAGSGAAPTYALDSSVLGGMYAGRIRIIATEAGVGVRMLGEAAASADDFTLNSAGKVEMQSAVSAARDASITSTSASGTADLFLNSAGAKISASRDVLLTATSGQIKLTEGELYAANNLTLTSATLSDVSTAAKTRFAKVNNTLVTSGAASIDGGVWGAGSALSGAFGSLAIGANGSTIYAGTTLGLSATNDLALATAAVRSAGDMTLNSSAGMISTAAGSTQGVQTTAGNLSLTAGNGLTNAGTMTSDAGSVTARVNGTVNNSGTLHAKTTFDIADKTNGSTENVTNSGILMADGNIAARAASFHNLFGARLQAATGSVLSATNLTNDGTYIASSTVGQTGKIDLSGALVNSWILHSAGNLTIDAASINNSAPAGAISALNTLTLHATGGGLSNGGALYAGELLKASATGKLTNQSTGEIDSSGSIDLSARDIENRNKINATTDITITAGNSFVNAPATLPTLYEKPPVIVEPTNEIKTYIEKGMQAYDNTLRIFEEIQRVDYFTDSPLGQVPQIVAGQTLTINYGTRGENKAALLSAGDLLTIAGSGTFTNQSFDLESTTYSKRWAKFFDSDGAVVYVGTGDVTFWYANNEVQWANGPSLVGNDAYATWPSVDGVKVYWALAGKAASVSPTDNQAKAAQSARIALLETQSKANAFRKVLYTTSSNTITSAGIHASYGKVDISGGHLINRGATSASDTTVTGADVDALLKPVQGASVTSKGADSIGFAGLPTTLPANPNGLFVTPVNPGAGYLVETNPLFAVGSPYVGSDYMLSRFGYSPDDIMKRLGDSNYEAYLIRQQLIAQTGNNIIKGYGNEASQMKQLMDQALDQSQSGGFTFGKALTPAQIDRLDKDVVWMVETTVAGQKVLAPVVYLAANTRSAILRGAVISGEHVKMDVTSLTNTGGTIDGSVSLDVLSQGDITNTSGTLHGGKGSLVSTEGSIVNETLVNGGGDDLTYATAIGNTGSISFDGDMKMLAKKDIIIKGATVAAGTDGLDHEVSMVAEDGTVRFDTIVDKTTHTTSSSSSTYLQDSTTTSTTTSERNIGSKLQLGPQAGHDARKAAEAQMQQTVNELQDLNKDIAKLQAIVKHNEETGVPSDPALLGQLHSAQITAKGLQVEQATLQAKADSLPVTNLTMRAGDKVVVRGSDVMVSGDGDVKGANGVQIVDAQDTTRTTSQTNTTDYFSMGKSDSDSKSASVSDSGSQSSKGGSASANASTGTGADASATADLNIMSNTVTTTTSGSNTSRGSNVSFGGNLVAAVDDPKGELLIQGSTLSTGGSANLDGAQNVTVTTGRNETWSRTESNTTSVGLFNEASAEAGSHANADASTSGSRASAEAGASAKAGATTTLGVQTVNEVTDTYKLQNSTGAINTGRNLSINLTNGDATFEGAQVTYGGEANIHGENIVNKAVQDIDFTSSSRTSQLTGLYIDANASTETQAGAGAGNLYPGEKVNSADASAEAETGVSGGLRSKTENSSSTDGSIAQVASSFTGRDLTRTATNTITDEGTQLNTNVVQSAREITDVAISNSTFSTSTSSSDDVKLGLGASASASASASSDGKAETEAGAGKGARASYEGSNETSSESSTTAVVTRYGGSVDSSSTGKTTLIGTQFSGNGTINIDAGSLDSKAAYDTHTKSSTAQDIELSGKLDGGKKPEGSLDGSYSSTSETESSRTARVSNMSSATGPININVRDDARFEGTNITAGGPVNVLVGGNLTLDAARNTVETSSKMFGGSMELSGSKGGEKEAGLAGSITQDRSYSETAQVGSIQSGAEGTHIVSGGNTSFEGIRLDSTGKTLVEAGGDVNLLAASNVEATSGFGLDAGLKASTSNEGRSQSGSIGGNAAYSGTVTSTPVSINSGGKAIVTGKNVVNQEAAITALAGKQIVGNEVKVKAERSDVSVDLEAKVSGSSDNKKPQLENIQVTTSLRTEVVDMVAGSEQPMAMPKTAVAALNMNVETKKAIINQAGLSKGLTGEVNADVAKAYSLAQGNPLKYAAGSPIQDEVLEKEKVLVQVRLEGTNSGSWMMRPEDIEGLSAQQIKDKFALPALPSFVSDVRVPAGTRIRKGMVALPPEATGGDVVQYELFKRLPNDAISNQRPLL
ncbi:two-partner secretion domain-containing protein [Sulfurirhabdus autotrophica]|uniref:Filamentous hemagglutinin family protein n=1 Tax=Sulfurirhabdus autotrophica TaxID=1706046 RepID=A0A4R3XYW7_9PROT|nr:hemagglutinin repeat-containing protein [Sulfurirhabdus autotrophica]TCV82883.1 filamentous hemagglutinin family protein [Sulfurirhabdus autotrophica]